MHRALRATLVRRLPSLPARVLGAFHLAQLVRRGCSFMTAGRRSTGVLGKSSGTHCSRRPLSSFEE